MSRLLQALTVCFAFAILALGLTTLIYLVLHPAWIVGILVVLFFVGLFGTIADQPAPKRPDRSGLLLALLGLGFLFSGDDDCDV